ncbi:LacI family DNA-binding transcriptional regulator [Microbacterium sp. GXF6406]
MSPRRSPADRAPNQNDVARLAGVSAQTVSRVMSGQSNVRPETARRVLSAVEELGYRVHAAAASLASGRTRILGVIVLSTNRYSTAALGVGIERVAAENGYTVTTASVSDHAPIEEIEAAFDLLERQGAEGIVLGVPVSLDHPGMRARTERTPSTRNVRVSADEDAAFAVDQTRVARLAVEHLLDLGHETVWHVSGDEYWTESVQRRETWEQVLREHGIEPPPVLPADWTSESGYRAGRTLAAIPGATAVFVSSDEMAFGVMRALHEAGRSVPDDVSIVSVDDIALAAYASPALTTVRQPFEEVGAAAARRVIAQIEGEAPVGEIPRVEPELILRASTAPPNLHQD